MKNQNFKFFRKFLWALFASLIIFLINTKFLTNEAKATNYAVSPVSSCTLVNAYLAIASGVAQGSCEAPSTDSNTIYLAKGTYLIESSLVPIQRDGNLNIIGESAVETIIDGNSANTGIVLNPPSSNNNYSISNLTIQNFIAVKNSGNVLTTYKGNIDINRLIIKDNSCVDIELPVCNLLGNSGDSNSIFSISNSAFVGNRAGFLIAAGNIDGIGTGVVSQLNMTNNTFSNNQGSILLFENHPPGANATANLLNNTFSNNSRMVSGVFVLNRQEPIPVDYQQVNLNLKNNIFYYNYRESSFPANCSTSSDLGDNATVTSLGGNLSSDSSCNEWFISTNDKNNIDSILLPLSLNSGTYVRPLASNSPAIGNAISSGSPSIDQRGVTRPQDGNYDSGAYEYQTGNIITGSTSYPQAGYLVGTGKDLRWIILSSAFLIASGIVFAIRNLHHRK